MSKGRRHLPFASAIFVLACLAIAVASSQPESDESSLSPMNHGMAPAPVDDAPIDPTTKEEVLEQIERSGLYVLDVENMVVHIHVQFYVQVNGVTQVIPQTGVDFDSLTAAPIHTHDTSGILHIENDTSHPAVPTVADFLEVWVGTSTDAGLCREFLDTNSCSVMASRNGQPFTLSEPLRNVDTVVLYVNDDGLL